MSIQIILLELFNSTDAFNSHLLKNRLFDSLRELYVAKNNGNSPSLDQLIEFTTKKNLTHLQAEENSELPRGTDIREPNVFIERMQSFLSDAVNYTQNPFHEWKIPLSFTYDTLFDANGCLTSVGASFERRLKNVLRFNQSFLDYRLQEKFYRKSEKPKMSSKIKQSAREFVFLQKYPRFFTLIPLLDSRLIRDISKYFKMVIGLYQDCDHQYGSLYWKENAEISNELFIVENQRYLDYALKNMQI